MIAMASNGHLEKAQFGWEAYFGRNALFYTNTTTNTENFGYERYLVRRLDFYTQFACIKT